MTKAFETPVLLLIFNRAETTQRVFNQIKLIKPKYLYVSADGPRESRPDDKQKCEDTRKIIQQVDWDCEVKLLFHENNIGCGIAVSTAISWFFQQVEEGIVLEDDCMASVSFFRFCEKMLDTYRNDLRIWHITGYNLQLGNKRGDADYFFSQETPVWGWATWRRVWKNFNLKLEKLPELERTHFRTTLKSSKLHSLTALYDYRKVVHGKKDIWDYNYSFYQLINNGLTIIPNVNLVENIGFDADATHQMKQAKTYMANKAVEVDYTEIKHPPFVLPDVIADKFTYNTRTRYLKKLYIF